MDLNPTKLDKKDHIFMDFFSMYGKSFIDQKKGKTSEVPCLAVMQKKVVEEAGNETPFKQLYELMSNK